MQTEGATSGATPLRTGKANAPLLQVRHTRTSALYVGIAVALLVLILILDFIIQNLHQVSIHFFTAQFRLPTGLVILASAVAGGILVLIASLARIAQLRLMARRHRQGKPTV